MFGSQSETYLAENIPHDIAYPLVQVLKTSPGSKYHAIGPLDLPILVDFCASAGNSPQSDSAAHY